MNQIEYLHELPSCSDCPDCSGTWDEHDGSCPAWHALDAMKRDDRAFFDKYPDVDVRRRKPVLQELMQMLAASGREVPEPPEGQCWHPGGYVLVYRTPSPDVRYRRFGHAYLVIDPDSPVTHWAAARKRR